MRQLVAVLLVAGALILGPTSPPRAGDNAGANRLLVEAVTLVERAEATEDPSARATLYERALNNLDAIVERHPESEVAVKLATGQRIGTLDRADIRRRGRLARAEHCSAELDRLCVLDVAFELTDADGGESDRGWTLVQIASGRAKAGAFDAAIEAANAITTFDDLPFALVDIARGQFEAGADVEARRTLSQAAEIARLLQDPFERSRALAEVAWAQAVVGNVAAARDSLRQALDAAGVLKFDPHRGLALSTIGKAQVQMGEGEAGRRSFEEAKNIATGDNRLRARQRLGILTELALDQNLDGDAARARQSVALAAALVNTTRNRKLGAIGLSWLVLAQAAVGDFEHAFATAARITSCSDRAGAHALIANEQFRQGHLDVARRTAADAFKEIRTAKDDSEIAWFLAIIGENMSK